MKTNQQTTKSMQKFQVGKELTFYFSAASSLAFTTTTSSSVPGVNKSSLGSNSLVHCLMKFVAKDNHKEAILKSLFGLLSNLAMSSECRNIIWKVSTCTFEFCCLLIIFKNSLDPDQARQNVRPDLDPSCLTL